ncbi:hypothetical protein PHYBOEH_005543 [Phytophthora boehmeriae]|uniref:E2F-associated phosphoprotein n=1 Tax=Phytophthora boehmeriae TaxID=109152 RepID=A0A8T1WNZ2_9STRA|nr:hypothetical protein PHYBOEH_005543 [Phytophthora boehmeriae]
MQRNDTGVVAFSAHNADTEDYYAFLPSDESMSDVEDDLTPSTPAKTSDLASTFASSDSGQSVLSHIGSLTLDKAVKQDTFKSTEIGPGVFSRGNGEELRLSPNTLAQHVARRGKLQEALDALKSGDKSNGEAPFRYLKQHKSVKQQTTVKQHKAVTFQEHKEHQEESEVESDPLYDEQLDDADEKWIRSQLSKAGTDATLCCPCCFVTVCMACERHAKFTNQYRSTAAINCRVKREEILTYTSGDNCSVPASLPFHKRQNLNSNKTKTTAAQQIAGLLQQDEFYPVACSDCGTMVGVFDRDQQYHFFNVLPSNC